MFCINCGSAVEETSVFCTNCGKRIKETPPVTVEEQENQNSTEQTTEPVITAEEALVQTEESVAVPVAEPVAPPPVYTAPPMPYIPEQPKPEKVYFGKGALAFCLVVIALLAISTGVFAGLYFAAL